ncbi:MAG: hypothetical protein JO171_19335 [Paludibacterium sp.]|uniref:hypothetical protein n=1 Tax=Paludibacterium sp. TaxID=1917523 RepID=UPI0025E52A87|nr:hypothetical protein [Paludibacterium sp.]MBV8049311.1 hypothetical protein [Paludibacterium sp.]MBV8645822.1 hypothetical protein [Paludibacterium sp.]
MFNDAQLDGLAKVCDNLATACIVASVAGGMVEQKVGTSTVSALLLLAVVLLALALCCRHSVSPKENSGNGH